MPIPSDPSVNKDQGWRVCGSPEYLPLSLWERTRVYGVEVDVDGLRSVSVDLHHG